MKTYFVLVENNQCEGETWNFAINMQNNLCLKKLLQEKFDMFSDDDSEETFKILNDILTETEVNTLCKYSGSGYMNNWNKIEIVDEEKVKELKNIDNFDDFLNFLNKGGLKK